MSLWAKVGAAGMVIGGVALAGTGIGAVATPALLAGAGQLLASDSKKEGAKKAETQLKEASDKAIGTLTTAQKASQQAYAPYQQVGSASMNALGSFMGLPTAASQAPSAQGPLASGFTGGVPGGLEVGSLPAGTQQALGVRGPSEEAPAPGTAVPRAGMTGPAATVQTQGAQQTASGYTPLGGIGAGGLVQMRAPTGATQWVPRQQAPFYAQRGAVEVG